MCGPFKVYEALWDVWGPLGLMGPFSVYGCVEVLRLMKIPVL